MSLLPIYHYNHKHPYIEPIQISDDKTLTQKTYSLLQEKLSHQADLNNKYACLNLGEEALHNKLLYCFLKEFRKDEFEFLSPYAEIFQLCLESSPREDIVTQLSEKTLALIENKISGFVSLLTKTNQQLSEFKKAYEKELEVLQAFFGQNGQSHLITQLNTLIKLMSDNQLIASEKIPSFLCQNQQLQKIAAYNLYSSEFNAHQKEISMLSQLKQKFELENLSCWLERNINDFEEELSMIPDIIDTIKSEDLKENQENVSPQEKINRPTLVPSHVRLHKRHANLAIRRRLFHPI